MDNDFRHFQSICPDCGKPVPAEYIRYDDAIYIVRSCPQHGTARILASEDAEAFERWITFPSVTVPPRVFLTKGGDCPEATECPLHCGPCENHLMTACCVLINVTERCNQHCPYCFAEAGEGGEETSVSKDPSLSVIERWLDRLVELGEERKFNIQLNGGEPTVRNDLQEIIRLCKEKGFEYVQLNTNGRKLADDVDYARALKAAGLTTVFLQFDGIDDEVYKALRGEPLFDIKKSAIENCAAAGLPVTLVPTVLKNVNLSQVGAIIDFMLDNVSVIKGVHFQPASFFGRKPDTRNESGDFDERVTMFSVMDEIEKQTDGRIKKTDLAPISTGHPLCCFCAALMKEKNGELRPLSSGGSCCGPELDPLEIVRRDRDFVLNKWDVAEALADDSQSQGSRLTSCSLRDSFPVCNKDYANLQGTVGFSQRNPEPCDCDANHARPHDSGCCESQETEHCDCDANHAKPHDSGCCDRATSFDEALAIFKNDTFTISGMAFMDETNLDAERLRRCRVQIFSSDEKLIPFCGFYTLYNGRKL